MSDVHNVLGANVVMSQIACLHSAHWSLSVLY